MVVLTLCAAQNAGHASTFTVAAGPNWGGARLRAAEAPGCAGSDFSQISAAGERRPPGSSPPRHRKLHSVSSRSMHSRMESATAPMTGS